MKSKSKKILILILALALIGSSAVFMSSGDLLQGRFQKLPMMDQPVKTKKSITKLKKKIITLNWEKANQPGYGYLIFGIADSYQDEAGDVKIRITQMFQPHNYQTVFWRSTNVQLQLYMDAKSVVANEFDINEKNIEIDRYEVCFQNSLNLTESVCTKADVGNNYYYLTKVNWEDITSEIMTFTEDDNNLAAAEIIVTMKAYTSIYDVDKKLKSTKVGEAVVITPQYNQTFGLDYPCLNMDMAGRFQCEDEDEDEDEDVIIPFAPLTS